MTLFDNPIFEHFAPEDIPQRSDLFMVDAKFMEHWGRCWAEKKGEGNDDVVFVSYISVEKASAHALELRWFLNISTRFHALQIILPRDKITAAFGINGYDEKIHLFVDSDWLAMLHSRLYAAFGMVDAIGVKDALRKGAIKKENLEGLLGRIDRIAVEHPEIAFVSFADSILLKGNWSVNYVRKGQPQTYQPEKLVVVFGKLSKAFQDELGLAAYGIFTQGSNEFYGNQLLHLSGPQNHVGLNALGAPFAQLLEIDAAVKQAIRTGEHPPVDLYLDEHFFASMNFESWECKDKARRAIYHSKIMDGTGIYIYSKYEEMLAQLKLAE